MPDSLGRAGSRTPTRKRAAAERTRNALGGRLREKRVERGLSLRELARRLDVSPSLVSQIETGKIQPSVRTLYAMAGTLGVSLDDVFAAGASRAGEHVSGGPRDGRPRSRAPGIAHVQRGDERSVIDLQSGVRWERLTTHSQPEVEFLYTVYPPGSESGPADELVRHAGREFGFVLGGRLGVTVGAEEHVLGPGDSVFFESTTPHRLHNDGDEEVTAVWVVLGRR
jgi:transcriptional regulator with XRE-family HTH domain